MFVRTPKAANIPASQRLCVSAVLSLVVNVPIAIDKKYGVIVSISTDAPGMQIAITKNDIL
jgi:hypothetical protein